MNEKGVFRLEQDIIVLFARPYEFKDEDGRNLKGVSVYYINQASTNNEKDGYGHIPVKVSLDNANDLKHLPGKYKATFGLHATAKGMQLKLSGLDYIDKAEIWTA